MARKLLFLLMFFTSISGYSFDQISLTGPATGPAGDWGIDVFMTTTDGVHYTLANHTFVNGQMKFRKNASWDFAYGYAAAPGFPNGTAAIPGTNIVATAGTYNVTFNLTTLVYSFTPGVSQNPVISVYGNSTVNTDILLSTTNGIDYIAKSITFAAGNVKFRRDNAWTQNWGATGFPSGTGTQNGADIPMPGGTYNISFNFNTGAYSFTPTAVGIIGVGGPSASWDNDATMTTTDAIHYTLNNVVITAGNFKIRDNGSWAVQFGTAGPTADTPFPSGSAIANGNDMKSETGTYNISFNRTTLEYNFQNALDVDSRNKQVFTVYPNPAVDSWTISSEHEIGEVTLFDVTGKVVNRVQSAETSVALDANGLSKGIYFAKVTSGQTSKTIKLIRK